VVAQVVPRVLLLVRQPQVVVLVEHYQVMEQTELLIQVAVVVEQVAHLQLAVLVVAE
jgi:hypothetical protein